MKITRLTGDVKAYGDGLTGGKGAGLARINECLIPHSKKIRTRILTTSIFDRFIENNGEFGDDDHSVFISILEELGEGPIGVRSSATNESGMSTDEKDLVHAGEYQSYMLPNNHPDPAIRLSMVQQAISNIYRDFVEKQPPASTEKMAIILNPVHGVLDETRAGPCYYPCISGVADSFFPHALKGQDPQEGFARIAFGHGYATILDDFPVISMATIRDPLPLKLLQIGRGQRYFYALDMRRNRDLGGGELDTMAKLHTKFADPRRLRVLGLEESFITIEELIQNDRFQFRTGLDEIMGTISSEITPHFQIEFVFNINFSDMEEDGVFHIVQLTPLPELKRESVQMPESPRHTYLAIENVQGHGIIRGITRAVVISPFLYEMEMHDEVRKSISEVNTAMREQGEDYILIVPGRLGSSNRDWGINIDYRELNHTSAIFEYGVDIAGRAEPLPEESGSTGGIYGSHFLYMIQGGHDEEKKRLRTRMQGTQGTHFLTNLIANNVIYGFIAPTEDILDPWFFSAPDPASALSVLTFPEPVAIYGDSLNQQCKVISDHG
ncbi:hypothetical protein ACFL6R_05865 [Gemmatimonadota bacterium]